MRTPILKIDDASSFKNCTLTYGHFNSVHPGHIRYLRHAASQGKFLVVAILPDLIKDGENIYQFNQRERAEGLTSFNFIDGVILLDNENYSFLRVIKKIHPSLLVLGTEFENSQDNEILKAIEIHDRERAEFAMSKHMADTYKRLSKLLPELKSEIKKM